MTILTDHNSVIDLKQLLILINDDRDRDAELCLDLDCRIATREPEALIQNLRTIITYIRSETQGTLSIGLSALRDAFDVVVVGRTDAATVSPKPEVSFETFGGKLLFEFSSENYLKAWIRFDRS